MKLKSFFILFSSIFLLSSLNIITAQEASAASQSSIDGSTITFSSTQTNCNASECPSACTADTTFTFKFGEEILSSYKCLGATTGDTDALVADCIWSCNQALQMIKKDVADYRPNISKNAFTKNACNVLRITTGGAGKTFATFAVIATGIGFFTGKVSWGLMIGVAAGIATMFGGPSIVAAISGQSSDMMCQLNPGP